MVIPRVFFACNDPFAEKMALLRAEWAQSEAQAHEAGR